jgi:uncharacterized protein (DUF608 family)
MADATFAEWVAERDGLPDVMNTKHLQEDLKASDKVLVAPWHDASGRLVGAINAVNANGSVITVAGRQPTEVWTGVSYFYAATLYGTGARFSIPILKAEGLAVAQAVAYQTWSVPQNGYAFDTPEAWLATDVTQHRALQYARPRSIWELVLAIRNPFG